MKSLQEPDLKPYMGRWVARVAGRIVGIGLTPKEARRCAARNRPKEKTTIGLVCMDHQGNPYIKPSLPLPKIMQELRLAMAPNDDGTPGSLERQRWPIFLVGGAVRDAVMGRISHDLDFVTGGNAIKIARSVANHFGGAFYVLDTKRQTARVIVVESPLMPPGLRSVVMDFACFREGPLQQDLACRDFTMNSMAIPIETDDPAAIVDPFNGQDDIANRTIRHTREDSFRRDPVRCLRAIRQSVELGFQVHPETERLIRQSAGRLSEISFERIRDEFCRILESPDAASALRRLDTLGLLASIVPELALAKTAVLTAPQFNNVFEHSLEVVNQLDTLLGALLVQQAEREKGNNFFLTSLTRISIWAQEINNHLSRLTAGDRTGRMLLLMAAVLHDIGKTTIPEFSNSQYPKDFSGHEQSGARLAENRARALAMSNDEIRQLGVIVKYHGEPARLARNCPKGQPNRRDVYRFYRDTQENGIDICLLGLADAMGRSSVPDRKEWDLLIKTVSTLMEHYFNHFDETIAPKQLINGHELMNILGLGPGPRVGKLLRLVEESQAAGEITTREEAIELARQTNSDQSFR